MQNADCRNGTPGKLMFRTDGVTQGEIRIRIAGDLKRNYLAKEFRVTKNMSYKHINKYKLDDSQKRS